MLKLGLNARYLSNLGLVFTTFVSFLILSSSTTSTEGASATASIIVPVACDFSSTTY